MPLQHLQHRLTNPPSRLMRVEEKVAILWQALVGMETEDSITLRETAQGSFCIGGGGGNGGMELSNAAFMAEARIGKDEHDNDVVEVKMLGGTVQGLLGGIETIKTTYWTTDNSELKLFPDVDDEDETIDIKTGETIDIGHVFWLEYDPEADDYDPETGEGGHWTVEHDEALPESDEQEEGDEEPEKIMYFSVIPLFLVSDQAEKNCIQYHFGSVYVPTVTNVVPVQKFQSAGNASGNGGGGGQ